MRGGVAGGADPDWRHRRGRTASAREWVLRQVRGLRAGGARDGDLQEGREPSSGYDAGRRSAPGADRRRPTHLYVLVHGFNSCAEHLSYLATEMRRRLGPTASVHLSRSNQARIPFVCHPTHDGIDTAASRLATEIREVVAQPEHTGLEYISFLGNSMGGLFLRYACGLLFDPDTSLIAGLHPVSFITTASPHLGVRGLLPKVLEQTLRVSTYGGRTAKQMLLLDTDDADDGGVSADVGIGKRPGFKGEREPAGGGRGRTGKVCRPLLVEMTRDDVLPFLSALRAFQFRVLYGNVCNDPLVPYPTAMIADGNLTDWKTRADVSTQYPHIIHDSQAEVHAWPPAHSPPASIGGQCRCWSNDAAAREMMADLGRVGWRRISARFERTVKVGKQHRPLPGFLAHAGVNAHNHLPVCRPLLDGGSGGGEGAVRHLCAVWIQHAHATHAEREARGICAPAQDAAPRQPWRAPSCQGAPTCELAEEGGTGGCSFLDARSPSPLGP